MRRLILIVMAFLFLAPSLSAEGAGNELDCAPIVPGYSGGYPGYDFSEPGYSIDEPGYLIEPLYSDGSPRYGRGPGRPSFKGAGPGPGYGDRGQRRGYGRSRSEGRGGGPLYPGAGPRQESFRSSAPIQ